MFLPCKMKNSCVRLGQISSQLMVQLFCACVKCLRLCLLFAHARSLFCIYSMIMFQLSSRDIRILDARSIAYIVWPLHLLIIFAHTIHLWVKQWGNYILYIYVVRGCNTRARLSFSLCVEHVVVVFFFLYLARFIVVFTRLLMSQSSEACEMSIILPHNICFSFFIVILGK